MMALLLGRRHRATTSLRPMVGLLLSSLFLFAAGAASASAASAGSGSGSGLIAPTPSDAAWEGRIAADEEADAQRRFLQASTTSWDIAPQDGYPVISMGSGSNSTSASSGGEESSKEVVFKYDYGGVVDENRILLVTLLQRDCVSLADPNALKFNQSEVDGVLTVDVDVVQEYISKSPFHYTEETGEENGEYTATGLITFCVRVDYSYVDPNSGVTASYNFHETKVDVTVDLIAGFELSEVATGRTAEDRTEADVDIGCNVTAYFCDDEGAEFVVEKYRQGDALQFCVRHHPDDKRLLYVKDIMETNIDSVALGEHSDIITNFVPDGLTVKDCENGICNVKTQLVSKWFALMGSYNLTVTGVAMCAFGRPGPSLRVDIEDWSAYMKDERDRKRRLGRGPRRQGQRQLRGRRQLERQHPNQWRNRTQLQRKLGDFDWDIIPRPGSPSAVFSNATRDREISFQYDTSEIIEGQKFLEARLFRDDCLTEADYAAINIRNEAMNEAGDVFSYDVDVVVGTIKDSVHYSEDNATSAKITFCARVDYMYEYPDGSQESMHFHETNVTVYVDLTAGFQLLSISTDLEQDTTNINTDIECPVICYHCNEDNVKVPGPIFTQGDQLQVCVEAYDPLTTTPLHVVEVMEMDLDTEYAHADPVTNYLADVLSTKVCEYGICNIKSQLTSVWFERINPPNIDLFGTALCKFGAAPTPPPERRLRRLQVGTSPSGGFDLIAELLVEGEALAEDTTSTTTMVLIVLVIVMLVLACCLCCCLCIAFKRRKRRQEEEEERRRKYLAGTVRRSSALSQCRFHRKHEKTIDLSERTLQFLAAPTIDISDQSSKEAGLVLGSASERSAASKKLGSASEGSAGSSEKFVDEPNLPQGEKKREDAPEPSAEKPGDGVASQQSQKKPEESSTKKSSSSLRSLDYDVSDKPRKKFSRRSSMGRSSSQRSLVDDGADKSPEPSSTSNNSCQRSLLNDTSERTQSRSKRKGRRPSIGRKRASQRGLLSDVSERSQGQVTNDVSETKPSRINSSSRRPSMGDKRASQRGLLSDVSEKSQGQMTNDPSEKKSSRTKSSRRASMGRSSQRGLLSDVSERSQGQMASYPSVLYPPPLVKRVSSGSPSLEDVSEHKIV